MKRYRPVTFTLAIFYLDKDHNLNEDFGSHLHFRQVRWSQLGFKSNKSSAVSEGAMEGESLTGWALQQSVHSKPKTHCHLQSGCAKERASDKRTERRRKDNSDLQCIACWKIPWFEGRGKQIMHPGGNRRILSNIMCTSDLAK